MLPRPRSAPFCRPIAIVILGMTIVCGSFFQVAMADEPQAQDKSQAADAARRTRMRDLARSYSFKVPNASEQVKLVEKPVFSWATPERSAIGGEMYLWTVQGRPFASIGMWTYDDVVDSHELQSFAEAPFEASTSSTTPNVAAMAKSAPWRPRAAGVTYKKLHEASPPENSVVRRMAQAKSILRERFSASVRHDGGNTEELRLLSQPLYRYQPNPPGVIDGLMFAFAMGTDPEVLVILEARTEADSSAWYFAIAPSTSIQAKCSIDGVQVWTSDQQSNNGTFQMYINK